MMSFSPWRSGKTDQKIEGESKTMKNWKKYLALVLALVM